MFSMAKNTKGDIEKYVSKAMILIHSPQTTKSIQKMLSLNDPVRQVANVTVMLMQRLDQAARQQKIEIDDTVKMFAAPVIVGLVCELAEAASLFNLEKPYKRLALATAMQDYFKGEIQAKRIDPGKFKQAMGQSILQQSPQVMQSAKAYSDAIPGIAAKYQKSLRGSKGKAGGAK